MARIESIALGGYYKTPEHLIPAIADLLDTEGLDDCRIADPCAGEGEAVFKLGTLLGVPQMYYLCELETARFATLKEGSRIYGRHNELVQGDAFQVKLDKGFLGLLYLNPPYDLDPVHGRLEQKFLKRFTQALCEEGLLIFLVPFYALKASAETLATEYDNLACYRFPDEDFAIYKQVVLVASKVPSRLRPDPKIAWQVQAWATSVDDCPVLGTPINKKHRVVSGHYSSLKSWEFIPFDFEGLTGRIRLWRQSGKGGLIQTPHILPDGPAETLMFKTFPVATMPRPAHIAAGIASGMFNGHRVVSQTPGFPPLLVKGVFDREYVTVREKENKEGDVVGVIQAQAPKLVTTILNLATKTYTTLHNEGRSSGVETIEDLLAHYGPSLMEVMAKQCPVLYNPERDAASLPLAAIERPLYRAQTDATKALVKLLGGSSCSRKARRYKAGILLGEIGSGKTGCALTVGKTIGRNMLVVCPPHLLDSWRDEAKKVIPDSEVRVLETTSDVDALLDVPKDRFLVAILSRETGKLGHSWEGVKGACPKCGFSVPFGDLAKKRQRCEARALIPSNGLARSAYALSLRMMTADPKNSRVQDILRGRLLATFRKKEAAPWKGFDSLWVRRTLQAAIKALIAGHREFGGRTITRLLMADYNESLIEKVLNTLLEQKDTYYCNDLCRIIVLLLKPNSELQQQFIEKLPRRFFYSDPASQVEKTEKDGVHTDVGVIKWTNGVLTLNDFEVGSLGIAKELLALLTDQGSFVEGPVCGEHLFQAVPKPRRYPVARYIAKKHPRFFDLFVTDECHENATDGSAQERSAHRINALGIPSILMTGSLMNGYAESLFTNMWAVSQDFRTEFRRNELQRYIDRYGYRERLVTERDKESKAPLVFGAHTDRVERSERITGDAPGVLPLFLFRHLLKFAVTLHKADLALDLPKCHHIKHSIQADPELQKAYQLTLDSLKSQIRKDRFKPEFAGKLFGALAELPSYLDRSTQDTGNQDDGSYEIRYPESLGAALVVRGTAFPSSKISNKERWMLDTLKAELAEGRNVMVFAWHVSLLPRLSRLIEQELGEAAPILYADKVASGKRQSWIDTHIIKKGRRILVANPVGISTGLNNLVHFSSEVWMENPGANPNTVRQAVGRVDRIGQRKETRIHFPVYANTLQVQLYDLLMRKIAVATSTDGLDPESVLLAAGASSDGYLTGLSIGRQLWDMLNADN